MRLPILLIIYLFPLLCFSTTIYVQTNGNNVTYSDTPISNSKKIEIQSGNNVLPEKKIATQPTTPSTTPAEPTTETTYKTFEMISPKDQQTFQNQRDIPVEIKIEPELAKENKIALYVDGGRSGEPQSKTKLMLQQVERGAHQINAALLDKNNNVILKTPAITIFIHYASAVTPPPRTGG